MGQCLMPKDIEFDMCVYINIRLVFQTKTITSTHGCYVYYVYNSDNKYKRIQLSFPNDTFTPLRSKFSYLYFNQTADNVEHTFKFID